MNDRQKARELAEELIEKGQGPGFFFNNVIIVAKAHLQLLDSTDRPDSVVVPVEPTEEMMFAAGARKRSLHYDECVRIYKTMISARDK